ncbi:MAG: crossover junction endodeoxyribonuclease RuvC [Deltaproteobacteria bacterium]|nr:crossover junction endodeoxyribonuclease RuvC [Deltaproteobacteria bacterium]
MLRVLGIDPGSQTTGYGVVEARGNRLVCIAHGTICAPRRQTLPARLAAIYEGLKGVLEAHQPEEVGVESTFYGRNLQSAFSLGQARGVALLTAELSGRPIAEYTPMQVKAAVVGYGRAEKRQVQEMVRRILGLSSVVGTDASDALAVAICHLQTSRTLRAYVSARPLTAGHNRAGKGKT